MCGLPKALHACVPPEDAATAAAAGLATAIAGVAVDDVDLAGAEATKAVKASIPQDGPGGPPLPNLEAREGVF